MPQKFNVSPEDSTPNFLYMYDKFGDIFFETVLIKIIGPCKKLLPFLKDIDGKMSYRIRVFVALFSSSKKYQGCWHFSCDDTVSLYHDGVQAAKVALSRM
jgi:hypothetical protein